MLTSCSSRPNVGSIEHSVRESSAAYATAASNAEQRICAANPAARLWSTPADDLAVSRSERDARGQADVCEGRASSSSEARPNAVSGSSSCDTGGGMWEFCFPGEQQHPARGTACKRRNEQVQATSEQSHVRRRLSVEQPPPIQLVATETAITRVGDASTNFGKRSLSRSGPHHPAKARRPG